MELILGTAQLARRYGVVATDRAPDAASATALLSAAYDLGVRCVDTAPAYGAAEDFIGTSGLPFQVHTKLDPRISPARSLAGSLDRLCRDRVDVLYVHDPDAVHDPSTLDAARELVGDRVGTLGASVYTADAARAAADAGLGAVQVPLNVLDRRVSDEFLTEMAAAGIQVLARSVLLQGLLADPGGGLGRVEGLDAALRSFARAASDLGRSPVELALGWVRARPGVDAVVLGAEDAHQLRRLSEALAAPALDSEELSVLVAVEHDDGAPGGLPVDPRRWGA